LSRNKDTPRFGSKALKKTVRNLSSSWIEFPVARLEFETLNWASCFSGDLSEAAGKPERPDASRSSRMKTLLSKLILGMMMVGFLAGCAGLAVTPVREQQRNEVPCC
jgi:hypothetical protein